MKRGRRFLGMRFVVLAAAGITVFTTVFGAIVMGLWNALMPGLFGLPVITFWQGAGLLVLSRLLFGGWPGRGKRPRFAHSMTPEERERFREGFRRRCGIPQSPEPRA